MEISPENRSIQYLDVIEIPTQDYIVYIIISFRSLTSKLIYIKRQYCRIFNVTTYRNPEFYPDPLAQKTEQFFPEEAYVVDIQNIYIPFSTFSKFQIRNRIVN